MTFVDVTVEQKNTIRAALDAHWDRIQAALRSAQRRKDEEHISMLNAELANVNVARKAIIAA